MDRKLELRLKVMFFNNEINLHDVVNYFLVDKQTRWPTWVVNPIIKGFEDHISGKRDLADTYGLTLRPGAQPDKSARKLSYSPAVYHEVVRRSKAGEPIDIGMFEKIAAEMEPNFRKEWPKAKPPGAETLKKWYIEELKDREPELAKKRVK